MRNAHLVHILYDLLAQFMSMSELGTDIVQSFV